MGGNNRSIEFGGAIDAIDSQSPGGAMVKIGTGWLILSGQTAFGDGISTVDAGDFLIV